MKNERPFFFMNSGTLSMPKLTDVQQDERRARILDAAERCFTRAGFHRTTMQDICKDAGVSPGAVYTWFDSKEALIGGITSRNRDEVLASFGPMAGADDFVAGLAATLEECILNRPREKSVLNLEIAAEATRNGVVADMMAKFDEAVNLSLKDIMERAIKTGQISPDLPVADLVASMNVIAEGMFWRRAVDPNFDAAAAGRVFVAMVSAVLRPGSTQEFMKQKQASSLKPMELAEQRT
jgi:AcrR family transcriptional regulator